MGIVNCRDKFAACLPEGHTVTSATLDNEDGGKVQRLTFKVMLPNGSYQTFVDRLTAPHDPTLFAHAMGQAAAATLTQGPPK